MTAWNTADHEDDEGWRRRKSNANVGSVVTVESTSMSSACNEDFSRNWQMRLRYEVRMLSEDLQVRRCEARVSAEKEGGDECVVFRVLKEWSRDAHTDSGCH